MKKLMILLLMGAILLISTSCEQAVRAGNTTEPDTIVSEEPTTEGSVLSETLETTVPEETTTAAEVTTSETTLAPTATPTPEPTVTAAPTSTPVPTKAPTPKPTKAPVETTAAPQPTTAATTAAPTDPPPTTTTAARYTENPDNIRALIVQYCVDNNLWFPGEEVNGSGYESYYIGCYTSDQRYADAFSSWNIRGECEIVSVTCWIENGYINIAFEESYFPTPAPTA